MTTKAANEPGVKVGRGEKATFEQGDGTIVEMGIAGDAMSEPSPSKPCTEGGEHCFCVEPYTYVHGMDINEAFCCWCKEPKRITKSSQPVPGHGPYRTELVRRDG